jgi:hypothetical protein
LSIIGTHVGSSFHYDVLQLQDQHGGERIGKTIEDIRGEIRAIHRHTPAFGVNGGPTESPLLRERDV